MGAVEALGTTERGIFTDFCVGQINRSLDIGISGRPVKLQQNGSGAKLMMSLPWVGGVDWFWGRPVRLAAFFPVQNIGFPASGESSVSVGTVLAYIDQ